MYENSRHSPEAQQRLKDAPKIEISPATPEDVLGIRELEYETWKATYPSDESGITQDDVDWYFDIFKKSFSAKNIEKTALEIKELPDEQCVVVVKNETGKIIGFAWLEKKDDNNELGAIYVHPEYQGMNLGREIWDKAESFFDTHNNTLLTVEENNLRAIKFYEKLGFRDTGKRVTSLVFPSGAKFNEIEMVNKVGSVE